ncbi:MAG: hypothetical protein HYY57_01195, partial [Candidatus Omnitrophica bacterium]|nr:hypothetical protein [Candidatus Omnitrophota bacterium]
MSSISIIATLIVIVAGILRLQRLPLLRPIFRWFPVPLWCYALPMVASAAGWLPRTHEAYPILIRYWLPFTLALLLLGVNLTSIKTVGRMGLVATALGSI